MSLWYHKACRACKKACRALSSGRIRLSDAWRGRNFISESAYFFWHFKGWRWFCRFSFFYIYEHCRSGDPSVRTGRTFSKRIFCFCLWSQNSPKNHTGNPSDLSESDKAKRHRTASKPGTFHPRTCWRLCDAVSDTEKYFWSPYDKRRPSCTDLLFFRRNREQPGKPFPCNSAILPFYRSEKRKIRRSFCLASL